MMMPLKTDHTSLVVDPSDALDVIPSLPHLFDEPFADSSQIPTFLLSKLTRQYVTVALSGDGGDELFAGYNSYHWTHSFWQQARWLPHPLRNPLCQGIQAVLDNIDWIPQQWAETWNPAANKIYKGSGLCRAASLEEMYERFQSVRHQSEPMVLGCSGADAFKHMDYYATMQKMKHPLKKLMYRDVVHYLPDDILTKVDRASMGVSLEARVPVLDHRVVEFAARVPNSMLIKDNQRKWLLRQVLYKRVPPSLIERPKKGFGIPLKAWLDGPLRDWANDYLNPSRLKQEGYLDSSQVSQLWTEHQSGHRDWKYRLWGIIMFEAWLEKNAP